MINIKCVNNKSLSKAIPLQLWLGMLIISEDAQNTESILRLSWIKSVSFRNGLRIQLKIK